MRRQCGSSSSARRLPIATVQSSWKAPWLRKLSRIELERFRLDEPAVGHVVDHEMREVGLAGHRAERGELGRGEAGDVVRVGMRVGTRSSRASSGEAGIAEGWPRWRGGVVHDRLRCHVIPGRRIAASPEPITTTAAGRISTVALLLRSRRLWVPGSRRCAARPGMTLPYKRVPLPIKTIQPISRAVPCPSRTSGARA